MHESCALQFPGEIIASQFVNFGAKVILSARNIAELERVKHELVAKSIIRVIFVLYCRGTKEYIIIWTLRASLFGTSNFLAVPGI